jgi:hypothetical protein
MQRRLRDQLPPAWFSLFKSVPKLALIVTATIFVTPEALAEVKSHRAEPVFTMVGTKSADEPKIVEKTYTKEELNRKIPANPVIGIGDRIASEVTALFKRMAANQSGSDQQAAHKKLKTSEAGRDQILMSAATLKGNPKTRTANIDNIRVFLLGESQKAATTRAKSELTLLNDFNSGMSFDLDAASLFAKDDDVKPTAGKVRYGLVLKDIQADPNAPKQAAINDAATDLNYAGHADVQWTIGPVSEQSGRKLFAFKEHMAASETPKSEGFWSRLWTPKAAMKGKVTPENFDNIAKVKDGESLPAWNIQLSQSENFYSLTYRTKLSGEKLEELHDFRVPVAGTVALGRRFNDQWDVVSTSAYNILYDKRLPLVSIHYLNIEERYKGTMGVELDKSSSLALTAQGETKSETVKKEARNKQFGLEYNKTF